MEEAHLALDGITQDHRLNLIKLRQANRQVQLALKSAKGATAQARLQYDTAELSRQAAVFQRDHVRGEIVACQSLEHLWEQLGLSYPPGSDEQMEYEVIKETLLQERLHRESLKAQLDRERSIRDAEVAVLEAKQRDFDQLLEQVSSLLRMADNLKLTLRLTEETVKELVKDLPVDIENGGTLFTVRSANTAVVLRQQGMAVQLEQEEEIVRTVSIEDVMELRETLEDLFSTKAL